MIDYDRSLRSIRDTARRYAARYARKRDDAGRWGLWADMAADAAALLRITVTDGSEYTMKARDLRKRFDREMDREPEVKA